jgi:PAS domain S-box-containing protein
MIEKSRDGICITQNGMFKYVNKAFCDLLGYSSQEIIKMPGAEMLAPWDKERVMAQHYKRMEGTAGKDIDTTTLIRKDGSYVDIEMSASSIEYEGSMASFISARDITERNQMLLAIEKSEQKYRMLVENAKDGIAITQDGKFKFVNKALCEFLEFTEDELVEMDFLRVVAEEDRERLKQYHTLRMSGSRHSMIYEAKAISKSGKMINLELNTTYIDFNNRPATFIILRNMTERKRAEEELKAAHKKLEDINHHLEQMIEERTHELTEVNTQLIKLQKENLQSQFDVLKQQVNPHFLFNSLNVLTSLIRIEPDLAEKFTEHLAKVYRYVLENKDNELVPLTTELEFLDAYMFLLNIRFMGKLSVRINIPEIEKNCMVIPLALQLLIENAIKHNTMSKRSPLVIDIFIDEKNYLNIINNLQERETNMASTGVGLKNIQNRYLLLNSTAPEFEKTGTQFIARIPLICDDSNCCT